jgi:hypothetical protein
MKSQHAILPASGVTKRRSEASPLKPFVGDPATQTLVYPNPGYTRLDKSSFLSIDEPSDPESGDGPMILKNDLEDEIITLRRI